MRKNLIYAAPLVALAAVGTPTHVAGAQGLPAWKITDICAKESAPGQCAAFEGRAANAVSASWPFVLESVKQACLGQIKSPLDQSWRVLADCIDNETGKVVDKTAVHTAKTPAEPLPPPRPPEAAAPAPAPAPAPTPAPAPGPAAAQPDAGAPAGQAPAEPSAPRPQ